MIELTRLNQELIYINPFIIESLEKTTSTVLTLSNGKKYMVVEPVDEISKRIFEWWESVFKLNSRKDFIENIKNKL